MYHIIQYEICMHIILYKVVSNDIIWYFVIPHYNMQYFNNFFVLWFYDTGGLIKVMPYLGELHNLLLSMFELCMSSCTFAWLLVLWTLYMYYIIGDGFLNHFRVCFRSHANICMVPDCYGDAGLLCKVYSVSTFRATSYSPTSWYHSAP